MSAPAALPDGACDCHVHVVGPQADYPMAPDRHYTPGLATHEDLMRHLAVMGLSRAVIVQPSVYGHDNRCMLASLAQMNGAGRGIAVAPADIGDEALRELDRGWVRGLRLNLESAGQSDPKAIRQGLSAWADRVGPLGWHLQVYASLDAIAAAAPALGGLPVPVVLDHFAMIPADPSPSDPRVRAVFDLVRSGSAYVKLSASYRIEPPGGLPDATSRLARAFIDCNPERIVWASDWPHTDREPGKSPLEVSAYRRIGAPRLQREIADWFSDPDLREQVLVRNPARLYGF